MPGRLLLFCLLFSPFAILNAQCPEPLWSDEFDGDELNLDNWSYVLGDGCDRGICGWGNGELQYYQSDNAQVADGKLTITAERVRVNNQDYTSARLSSKGKQDFRYGHLEARVRLPEGRGTWPAFWMLSTDEVYGTWPQSGEIDIMEYVGQKPNEVFGTIHFGRPFPANQFIGEAYQRPGDPFHEDYHTFAVQWEPNRIRWFVDGILYSTKSRADVSPQRWPFDQEFHFILNLAIGGTLGGTVDQRIFPVTMDVDYVRVYENGRPFISGAFEVDNRAVNESYSIGNVDPGTVVTWSVPAGATIRAGQGTPTATVDFGDVSGEVVARFSAACGQQEIRLPVEVGTAFVRNFYLENFDDPEQLFLQATSGVLSEVPNPAPDSLNASATVGRYARDTTSEFDVILYQTGNTIESGTPYFTGEEAILIDVLTDARAGTEILLQLESGAAGPENYPTGRHSRYQARTTGAEGWERLQFLPLDRPDDNVNPRAIGRLVLLFAPGTSTGTTFYFDNLDSYAEASTPVHQPAATGPALQLAPNPVTDRANLTVDIRYTTDLRWELLDVSGRKITAKHAGTLQTGRHLIPVDTRSLRAGLYLLRVSTPLGSQTLRLLRR